MLVQTEKSLTETRYYELLTLFNKESSDLFYGKCISEGYILSLVVLARVGLVEGYILSIVVLVRVGLVRGLYPQSSRVGTGWAGTRAISSV
jgi:hypothetical protein